MLGNIFEVVSSIFSKYISRKELIDILKSLSEIDTTNPPGNEYKIAPLISNYLRDIGMSVKRYEKVKNRTNVVGVIGRGYPKLAFFIHTDTVPVNINDWKYNPFKVKIVGDKVYGRGVVDNKGMFAVCYCAIKAYLLWLKESNKKLSGSIYILACADEEKGSKLGAKWLIPILKKKGIIFDGAIVPDGGSIDRAVYGEKGVLHINILSKGKSSHGSTPQKGKNAIVPLAQLAVELSRIKFPKKWHPSFTPPSLNIGTFNGGLAKNVVPSEAKIGVDIRLPLGLEKDKVLELIKAKIKNVKNKYPWSRFKIEIENFQSPHLADKDSFIIKALANACKKVGITLKLETIGGASIAKFLTIHGIPSILHLPADMEQMHMPNEHTSISLLEKGIEIYAETIKNFCETANVSKNTKK